MFRALGAWWHPVVIVLAKFRSARSPPSAIAPKPLAQRASISRRFIGGGLKRPQWCVLVSFMVQWR